MIKRSCKVIMATVRILVMLGLAFVLTPAVHGEAKQFRMFVVSSYHPEYLWSQETHQGVCAGLLDFDFLDNKQQVEEYTRHNYVESSKAVIKKAWMDTKRRSSEAEIASTTVRLVKEIDEFKPDLLLLGDDNAANYLGNQYLNTRIPVVFWGINGLPLKYGLVQSLKKPGHNVTGVYQSGYSQECVEFLKKLVPTVETFAMLSDESETGKSMVKNLGKLAAAGKLPLKLVGTIVTDSFSDWQAGALRLQKKADAFFVATHGTLKDDTGKPVDHLQAGAWYLRHVKKPDCAPAKHFVEEGILLSVDDSGFKQGYEAVRIASQILQEGKDPGNIPVYAPERGTMSLNRQRARMLGIDLTQKDFIEEFIDKALALEKYPQ